MAVTDGSSGGKATGLDSNAIYYEVSPTIICIMRLCNVTVLVMALIAILICVIKGLDEAHHDFLLVTNIVLSGLMAIVINWWYRKSDLSADKYWFVFLIAGLLLFQSIVTIVYAFHKAPPPPTPAPTHHTIPHHTNRTTPWTGKTVTWVTVNTSTITPPPQAFHTRPWFGGP